MASEILHTAEPPPAPGGSRHDRGEPALWIAFSPDRAAEGRPLALDPGDSAVVGRDGDELAIDDAWLSQAHLRISRTGRSSSAADDVWRVHDLQTRNGTRVNRRPVTQRELRPGDVVRCGATLMVFEAGAPSGGDNLGLVGRSAALAAVRAQIDRVAQRSQAVHITGESGVGKEIVAHALHRRSGRSGPLVVLNMASIVASIAESQLFGHRRGAFSGAERDQRGLIDRADGGTLFLDEIGELAPDVQAKLLRVVESGEVHPIGDAQPHRVDLRLVTATHRALQDMVREGTFRGDLYWRLAGCVIPLPPLRERRLDTIPILRYFLQEQEIDLHEICGKQPPAAWHLADLLEPLLCYGWPGNVRQLRQQAALLASALSDRADSDPVPAPDQVFAPPLLELEPDRGDGAAPQTNDAAEPAAGSAEAQRAILALEQPDTLIAAIREQAGGRINAFARLVAPLVGRSESSIRREIYRRLGDDGLEELRRSRTRSS